MKNYSYESDGPRWVFPTLCVALLVGAILIPAIKRLTNQPTKINPEPVAEQAAVVEIIPTAEVLDETNVASVKTEVDPTTEAALNKMGFSMSNSVKISVK